MNKYVEHIINDLVRDTKIDYEKDKIYFPFSHFPPHPPRTPSLLYFHSSILSFFHSPNYFSKYCKNTFGLTKEEIDYVWDQYKSILKDKISKRES